MVIPPDILLNNTDKWYYDENEEVANMRARPGASAEIKAAVDEMNRQDREASKKGLEV